MITKYKKFCDLRKNYKKAILENKVTTVKQAIAIAVKMPYPSFYISPEHCYAIMLNIEHNADYLSKIANKETIRKYMELYKRYCMLLDNNKYMSKREACDIVVNQEAPELYMSVNAAYNFYFYNRKKEHLLQKLNSI